LYKVLERVRAKYPKVPMMLCSGGGGRADYEALKYFTEFWPSDDTDPLERIFMQWEYSYFFPAIATCNHITDWSNLPLKYRTDVAMMGKMGYDIVVSKLNETDLKFSQQSVATYKSINDITWHGDEYRLASPWEKPYAELQFVNQNRDKSIVFAYLTEFRFMNTSASASPAPLKGLDPQKKYKVSEINLYPGTRSSIAADAVFSGEYLMTVGVNPDINNRRTSVVLQIEEVK
jgi:alpha-galactosidase